MPPGNAAMAFIDRIHVGGLGIVVVVDAVDLRDKLQAMLDRVKFRDRFANRRRFNARQTRRAHRRQDVLHVMRAFQRNLRHFQHRLGRGLLRSAHR